MLAAGSGHPTHKHVPSSNVAPGLEFKAPGLVHPGMSVWAKEHRAAANKTGVSRERRMWLGLRLEHKNGGKCCLSEQ